VRWIVLLITTICLVGGVRTTTGAPRVASPRSGLLKKWLPAAVSVARRARSVSSRRLPAFPVLTAPVAVSLRRGIADEREMALRGRSADLPANVAARGPPRA
jgi:hypothetical protein